MSPKNAASEYVQAGVVARMLHVSPKTVARWATDGELPYVRTLGGHRRFHRPTVQAIIDKLAQDDSQQANGHSQ